MANILTLKVSLDQISPSVWRRLEVPASIHFFHLHHILQIVMGWKNSHQFEFKVGEYRIGWPDPRFPEEALSDARLITLDLLLEKSGYSFTYLYDHGDHWLHTVTVESVSKPEKGKKFPVCLAGKMACPPEDCGGPSGFARLKRILKNEHHSEHESYREWAGWFYDPSDFHLLGINRKLHFYRRMMKNLGE